MMIFKCSTGSWVSDKYRADGSQLNPYARMMSSSTPDTKDGMLSPATTVDRAQ